VALSSVIHHLTPPTFQPPPSMAPPTTWVSSPIEGVLPRSPGGLITIGGGWPLRPDTGLALGAKLSMSDFFSNINNLALNLSRGVRHLGGIQIDCRPLSGRL